MFDKKCVSPDAGIMVHLMTNFYGKLIAKLKLKQCFYIDQRLSTSVYDTFYNLALYHFLDSEKCILCQMCHCCFAEKGCFHLNFVEISHSSLKVFVSILYVVPNEMGMCCILYTCHFAFTQETQVCSA